MRMNKRWTVGLAAAAALAVAAAPSWTRPENPVRPRPVPPAMFGPNMIRAEIILKAAGVVHDYRVDRGRIKAVSATSVILRARDGLLVSVPVAPDARIVMNNRRVPLGLLRREAEAFAVRDGERPADHLEASVGSARPLPAYLWGGNLVRAEVVVKTAGVLHDYRIDRGRIRGLAPGVITLRARDGLFVTIDVAPDARVYLNGRRVRFSALRHNLQATVIRDGERPAEQILAFRPR